MEDRIGVETDDVYFANLPTDKIGPRLVVRIDDYYDHLTTTGRLYLWQRSYQQYYRSVQTGGALFRSGEQGEFTQIAVNQFRNIVQHLEILTASQKPVFEPKAINTDYDSQAQCILAAGLLEYYLYEQKTARFIKSALENALWAGEGFISLGWDVDAGEEYMADAGRIVRLGDIVTRSYSPLEVVSDFRATSVQDVKWRILIDFVNRWDIIAKFPELKENIKSLGTDPLRERFSWRISQNFWQQNDFIPMYTFYHEKTVSVPNGRMVQFLSDDLILIDNPLPYKEMPIYRLCPSDQLQSIWGYTVCFDLLPLQEAYDDVIGIILTNVVTFGVQSIMTPIGSNISAEEVMNGLNFIQYDPQLGPPTPLQLTATAKETYNFLQIIDSLFGTISGVNAVARGNPEEAGLRGASGSALALLQSQAIQFSSGLQQSYADLLQDVGTGIVKILQEYASLPRVAMIAGKSHRSLLKSWTGKDLEKVTRVIVDLGNPLTQTIAGRVDLATQLLQNHMVDNPDQYIQVLTTGKLEPVYEGKQAELMLIRNENEDLQDGKDVHAVVTDNHSLHILEHKVVLASTTSRADPDLVQRTVNHLQEHINLLKTSDPSLLILLGQQPIQQAPPPAQGPGVPPQEGLQQAPHQPELPHLPTNPLSGKKFNNQTGGL